MLLGLALWLRDAINMVMFIAFLLEVVSIMAFDDIDELLAE